LNLSFVPVVIWKQELLVNNQIFSIMIVHIPKGGEAGCICTVSIHDPSTRRTVITGAHFFTTGAMTQQTGAGSGHLKQHGKFKN